jgi:hypothetical protein
MVKRHLEVGIAFLFVFALVAVPVRADPVAVYSNFGPGLSFQNDPQSGWTINGFLSPATGQQAISQLFTPADIYTFAGVRVPLSFHSGPNSIDLYLQADHGGLPGAVLDVMHLPALPVGPGVVSAESVSRPTLLANEAYWLSVVAGGPGVVAGWHWNTTGDVFDGRNFAGTQGGGPQGPWGLGPGENGPQFRSAFLIEGDLQAAPVPEPATLLLVAAGGAVACLKRRRHQGGGSTQRPRSAIRGGAAAR